MATGSPGAMFTDATTIAASDVPLNTDEGVKIFLIYRDMSMASCAAIRPTRSTAATASMSDTRFFFRSGKAEEGLTLLRSSPAIHQ